MAYDPNDPADKKILQDAIDAALETAAEEHQAEVTRLTDKNKELLGKLAKARTDNGGDNAAEISRLEGELDTVKSDLATATRNLSKAERDLAKATGERDTAVSERDTAVSERDNEFKNNALTSALAEANIAPHHTDAVRALLMAKNKLTVEGEADERQVLVNGKALGEFVKEYAASDTGKHYVIAPANGGGGATGPNGNGNPNGSKKLSEMSEQERTEMARSQPEAFQTLVAAEQGNTGAIVIQ
jgi:hypothetical protein